MTEQKQEPLEQLNQAIEELVATGSSASKFAAEAFLIASDEMVGMTAEVGYTVGRNTQIWAEQGTEVLGRVVTPIAENPFVKYAARVPGVGWLLGALGQVDTEKLHADVYNLRQQYSFETPEQIAHRVTVDTALKAGGIGLATNIVPPIALMLFAVDIAAVTALQAEMVYRIADIYGFSLDDPARRGEVLAIFGLWIGGSGALKLGLSFAEAIPLIGPTIGAATDAALIYGLGMVACRFYEAKRRSLTY